VGVDVGKSFDLVAIDEVHIVEQPTRVETVQEAIEWIRHVKPLLAAVDGPRSPAPDGERSRPCEREFLAAKICNIRATPDRATIAGRVDSYYGWIENGFALYGALCADSTAAIECFPTASWTRWVGRRGGRTRASWTADGLGALKLAATPTRTNQDVRDAIAAAVTARAHVQGRTETFGDLVIPLPSAEAVR
jgi:hypothetical protein